MVVLLVLSASLSVLAVNLVVVAIYNEYYFRH